MARGSERWGTVRDVGGGDPFNTSPLVVRRLVRSPSGYARLWLDGQARHHVARLRHDYGRRHIGNVAPKRESVGTRKKASGLFTSSPSESRVMQCEANHPDGKSFVRCERYLDWKAAHDRRSGFPLIPVIGSEDLDLEGGADLRTVWDAVTVGSPH